MDVWRRTLTSRKLYDIQWEQPCDMKLYSKFRRKMLTFAAWARIGYIVTEEY